MRSLAARIVTVTVALVALAVMVGVSGVWLMATRVVEEAVADALAVSQSMLRSQVPETAIDNEDAIEFKQITGVEVVFITLKDGLTVLSASTLDPQRDERLLSRLPEATMASLVRGDVIERIDLTFEGENWMARAEPVQDAAGTILGSVLTIGSLNARLASHRTMQNWQIGAGVLAILIALALSSLIARRVARSIAALAGVINQAAEGDYEQSIDTRGQDEVSSLARAISRLLANLREQEAIAGSVADLSRHLNEPDITGQPEVAAEVVPPRSGPALVLALEWRSSKAVTEHQAVAALEQWFPQLALWASQRHARLVPGGSARIYLVFDPGNTAGLERCLTTLLRECGTSSNPPAMALASGELISAGLDLGRGRSYLISGKPVFHCERLLTEAGPGRLLLSPPAFRELKDDFSRHNAQMVLSDGRVSRRKFYQLVSI